MRAILKLLLVPLVLAIILSTVAACGADEPTATAPSPVLDPTPTPIPPTPTPTLRPGVPTPTPAPPTPTPARDLEAYFSGKTIQIMVGYNPGGGFDTISRIFAHAAPKYFPGSPRFVVRNLAGAGGLRSLQYTMAQPPDGFTVNPTHSRFIIRRIIGVDVPGFDLNNVTIVGNPTGASTGSLFCVDKQLATNWDEVKALGRDITLGESVIGNATGPEFIEYLGGPIRTVYGYSGGTADIMAGFDRREVDGTTRCGSETVSRLYPEWVTEGRLAPLFWYRAEPIPAWMQELGVTAEVPNVVDIARDDLGATPDELSGYQSVLDVTGGITRSFLMPGGISDDIVEAWIKAFEATNNDPQFIERAGIAGYADSLAVLSGDAIREKIQRGQGLSPASLKVVRALVAEQ